MTYGIHGKTADWSIVVGLEVHCQIVSNSKIFSSASAAFGGEANTHVSFVDAAFPGMLPAFNEECLHQGIRTALALQGSIQPYSRFDRKHYFYGDSPMGYQISQYYHPLMRDGHLNITLADGTHKRIHINRMHLEADAGKLLHDHHPSASLIDLNRAGVGLMEIVSEPEITSPEEASAYLHQLRRLVRAIGTCDGNMEEGSMRCDVNVSVRRMNEVSLRTRTETKNVNSMRFVMQAIAFEAQRQVELWESDGVVVQETRLFDSTTGTTRSMRSKEDAMDYRYFSDPDLLPIRLSTDLIEQLARSLPELPDARVARYVADYGLSAADAQLLGQDTAYAAYFESMLSDNRDARSCAVMMVGSLFALLNKEGIDIAQSPIDSRRLAALVDLVQADTISGRTAKDVFAHMITDARFPVEIVQEQGLEQVSDDAALSALIDDLFATHGDKVLDVLNGNERMFPWFVGQVMKGTGGKANPALVNTLLQAAFEKRRCV